MNTYRKPGPAQIRYPWRSTLRTVLWAIVAFAAMAPLIYTAATQQEPGQAVGWVASALAILAAVQRVMTLPIVDEFLRRYLPWLAATPKDDAGVYEVRNDSGRPETVLTAEQAEKLRRITNDDEQP